MTTKITTADRVEKCKLSELPDGDYKGIWGGYVVEALIGGQLHRFTTENGVRGMNIPCVVMFQAGAVTVVTSK